MGQILKAAWVYPVAQPPIRNAYIALDGPRITAVGPATELSGCSPEWPATDLGDVMLLPGLINPHTHLELTCYLGSLPPGPFWGWLNQLMELRRAEGQLEREAAAVTTGAWQSLRAGVTCVGDISRRNLAWRPLKALPLRKVCYVELLSLADDPPRNPQELRAGVEEVVEDELLTVGITPHAPYTVPAEQIRAACRLAAELDRPWCLHWAETREEVAFLRGERGALPAFLEELLTQCGVVSPRSAPAGLLGRCCGEAPPGLLAHGNYATDADLEYLARAGHSVVYCPRAHRYFGHTPHPYRRLQAAGVNVAVGTDSAASNEDLSILNELHFLYTEVAEPLPPARLLELATVNAARALGLAERIGSLTPGREADLVAFPCRRGDANPLASLVSEPQSPAGVWVRGERCVTA